MFNQRELLQFIAKAHRNTYAAPKEIREKYSVKVPVLPGHKDFHYSDGPWSYYDSYAGSFRAPGRECVFFENRPAWAMAYSGMLKAEFTKDAGEIYSFLKTALMKFKDDIPYRGPSTWKEKNLTYEFSFRGDVSYLVGREAIKRDGIEVFFQDILASLIE